LTASASLVVGVFLVMGGYGHLNAVIPIWLAQDQSFGISSLVLLATGGVLLLPGVINLVTCWWIWRRRKWAFVLSLAATSASFLYLAYLLITGVPGHPIVFFAVLIGAYLALLVYAWSNLPGKT